MSDRPYFGMPNKQRRIFTAISVRPSRRAICPSGRVPRILSSSGRQRGGSPERMPFLFRRFATEVLLRFNRRASFPSDTFPNKASSALVQARTWPNPGIPSCCRRVATDFGGCPTNLAMSLSRLVPSSASSSGLHRLGFGFTVGIPRIWRCPPNRINGASQFCGDFPIRCRAQQRLFFWRPDGFGPGEWWNARIHSMPVNRRECAP